MTDLPDLPDLTVGKFVELASKKRDDLGDTPLGHALDESQKREPRPGGQETTIPDLLGITVEELASLDDTVLAEAIRLYRKRLCQTGAPLNSFNARI